MYKKTVLIMVIFSFILIFSSSISAVELEGELNSTFIKNEESDLKPILEGDLLINNLHNKLGIGLKAVYSDQSFSSYDIFSLINLDLVEKYKTNLIIGLSQYNGFKMKEEYRGFLLGSNIEKRYNENTIFFTNLIFSFYPNESMRKFKSGVKYKFNENTYLNFSYNDYDNENSGFTLGLGLSLDNK